MIKAQKQTSVWRRHAARSRFFRALRYETLERRDLLTTLLDPTGNGWGFGESVATSVASTVVGSPGADDQGVPQTGVAYLFNSSGTLVATFHNPTPDARDGFGYSTAISGNTVVI